MRSSSRCFHVWGALNGAPLVGAPLNSALLDGTPRARTPRARTPRVGTPRAGALFAVALLAVALGIATPACGAREPRTLRVGTLELERCPRGFAYCGAVERPLDPIDLSAGSIFIHFEYYPHTAPGASAGTLVATEGGPGYAATESRADYLALFAPLRRERDFVLMDNRGTGGSDAIDCPELQTAEKWTVELIGACGRSLGPKAALYGTAFAADDLAEILTRLRAGRIDLYGDSYGTYFEQVFALRHPAMLRSIVLDGAYPLDGPDYAWYPSYAPAMRERFNLSCRRSAACEAIPGSSIRHIQAALDRLRTNPFAARAADSDARERAFTANASQLAIVMFASAPALATAREVDAAARAFAAGDRAPLLRLMAETDSAVDSRDPSANPAVWSAGLSALVMCHDPPQIYDMRLEPAARIADRDRALADRRRLAPDTYAPFTIDEFRGVPLDYSFLDQCIEWPVAPPDHPASAVTALDAPYPDVPVLVISGEFDDITTPSDGAAIAAKFRRGRQVVIANSFHVNALPRARSPCGARIARRFIAALDPGDIGCAARVPPLRLVARFVLRIEEIEPARAIGGNLASELELRAARGAVMTAGDVLVHARSNSSGHGVGLRGGSFEIGARAQSAHIVLHGVRWTSDLSVSGTIDEPHDRTRPVTARLRIQGPLGLTGRIDARWREDVPDARAKIRGLIGSRPLVAEIDAP
jgi:pimeloyl-ACP methyl ester carboxylesterase